MAVPKKYMNGEGESKEIFYNKSERVERARATATIAREFDSLVRAMPAESDAKEYFRTIAPHIDALIAQNTAALDEQRLQSIKRTFATITRGLISRNEEVKRIGASMKEILASLSSANEFHGIGIGADEVIAYDASDPFDITVTLSPSVFRRFQPDVTRDDDLFSGMHIVGTPISIIREGISNPQIVINHERLHARLAGLSNIVPPTMKIMGDIVTYGSIGEHPRIFNAAEYLVEFHEEIAGGIEFAVSRNFDVIPGKTPSVDFIDTYNRYEKVMATAGMYMSQLRGAIRMAQDDLSVPVAVRTRLSRFLIDVAKEFNSTVGAIERAVRAIERKPREVQYSLMHDVYMLAYLLPLKEYEDIALLMES